jgi:hypothetical protein
MNWRHALASLIAGLSVDALAHVTSTGLASVTIEGRRVEWRLSLPLSDLAEAHQRLIERATSGDTASAERAADLLRAHVSVATAGETCRPGRVRLRGPVYRAALEIEFACRAAPGKLELTDTLSEVFGEHYRTIVSVSGPDGARTERAFEKGATRAVFDFSRPLPSQAGQFLALGVQHIITGWDHLLFLAALLTGVRGAWRVLGIVTAFTAAHSATLALAVLKIVDIPSAIIEPAIAASIVWVALENLLAPGAAARRWMVALAFGLVHGLGFASALAEIRLSGWPLASALLAFNAGVELGQAAVVLLLAPLFAWLARRSAAPAYARAISIALAIVGAAWFIERILA